MTLLQVQDLRVRFHGRHVAVDGVDFGIAAGETVAVVGESGSGKSVTALSILRLFGAADAAETSGRILWRDAQGGVQDLLALPEPRMRDLRGRDIAIIFQDPGANLNPVFSIGRQIAEVLQRHRGLARAAAMQQAEALLRQVGISDAARRLHAFPHQLSGGMRQRVMIAIALACSPRLLIADEPTTALDVTIQAQILHLLRQLQASTGSGLIFITHDLELVSDIADRVVVMYAGQVVETGPVQQVLAQPRHPYTAALLACRPHRGADGAVHFAPIPGAPPRGGSFPAGCRFAARCTLATPACTGGPVALQEVSAGRAARCLHTDRLA